MQGERLMQTNTMAPAFTGIVRPFEVKDKQLLATHVMANPATKASFDTFCTQLSKDIKDPAITSDNGVIKMSFENNPKEGFLCNLKYSVPEFLSKVKFEDLTVNVFDKASLGKIKAWLQGNKETVNGKDDLIIGIARAIRNTGNLDWDYQGILPMDNRKEMTECTNESLKMFGDTLNELDRVLTLLKQKDPEAKRIKIMFKNTQKVLGENYQERLERANQTPYLTYVDVSDLQRHSKLLSGVVKNVDDLKFNQDSEGLMVMSKWLQTNIIEPLDKLTENYEAVETQLRKFQ